MKDTRNIGLVLIGVGLFMKSFLVAGAGLLVVLAVNEGTLPATLPSSAGGAFKLTNGLNNSGDTVTPSPDLTVQAWPGAYGS